VYELNNTIKASEQEIESSSVCLSIQVVAEYLPHYDKDALEHLVVKIEIICWILIIKSCPFWTHIGVKWMVPGQVTNG